MEEVTERVRADGVIERALDESQAACALQAAFDQGLRACAIVFMHAWRFPGHEQSAARIARDIGFTQITVSHEASPLIKLIGRGDTAVADAYLTPVLRCYIDRVAQELGARGSRKGAPRLMFMMSSGGLTTANMFQGKDAIPLRPRRRRCRHGAHRRERRLS